MKFPNLECLSVDRRLEITTEVLKTAAKNGVPSVITRLKGPSFKLSPSVKFHMKKRKEVFFKWKEAGRPPKGHTLYEQKKQASKDLRKQVRKEFAMDRQKFLGEVMNHPSDQNFYRLIKRNQGQKEKTESGCIRFKGEDIFDSEIQGKNFSVYFEDLALPKNNNSFDKDFYQLNKIQHACIREICEQSDDVITPFSAKEVQDSVRSLNANKAPDEFGLVSEHLKYGLKPLLPLLVNIYNEIIASGIIPANFKSGIIHPIHKKGKDPTSMDNYRGITVTSVFGKLFEILLRTRMTDLNHNQSDLQYGFTKGLTPTMASLILSEAEADAKMRKQPLYIATLDTQKAFDVVDHTILLNKLYEEGINQKIWLIVRELYSGLTAKIKWKSVLGDSFKVFQGVRQGGVISTRFYKVYVNGFMIELRMNSLGKWIGYIYVGCPACADDVLLITEDPEELQIMFAIAKSYSGCHRYVIHPQKTQVVCKHCSSAANGCARQEWNIGENVLHLSDRTTHLGLARTDKNDSAVNIEDRISLARRTGYSLMKSGFHGSNGLNPKVSYRLYQTYVLPRMLYSLEILDLRKSDVKQLSDFHVDLLRRIQSLPSRTALSPVYLLLGALPMEAELHKRQLSLIFSIVSSTNETLHQLVQRALGLHDLSYAGFFKRVSETLNLYQLPTIRQLLECTPSKLEWKRQTRQALHNYWTTSLVADAMVKTTLSHCSIGNLKIGHTHMVWDSIQPNLQDVKRGHTKARLLTGTYMLQSTKYKFNSAEVDPKCPLCRLESEDLQHFILRCPALAEARDRYFPLIRKLVIDAVGEIIWSEHFCNRDILVTLVIDCQKLAENRLLPRSTDTLFEIESCSRTLCYKLHQLRLKLHKEL